ncbi:MAG: hypothetical protein K2G95_01495, partial [Muribaculaceae bacterium]|nr:hypothetical protein [Muribaculaceae bacterium]
HYVVPTDSPAAQPEGWRTCWYIFSLYALVIAVLFWIIFPSVKNSNEKIQADKAYDLNTESE